MSIQTWLCCSLLLLPASFAQTRSSGGFGNVVFPGGTSAQPGVTRSFGNVAFPGTGGPRVNIPFSITDPTFGARLGANVGGQNVLRQSGGYGGGGGFRRSTVVAVPVYIGGGYNYIDSPYQQPVQQQQPVTVVYPPQPAPVIINQYGPAQPVTPPADTISMYQAPVTSGNNPEGVSSGEPKTGYLIALKDHTIYNAVAYWIDGDTLHYFTAGNVHNQASLSLVDRDLTDRLNREKGTEVRLPK